MQTGVNSCVNSVNLGILMAQSGIVSKDFGLSGHATCAHTNIHTSKSSDHVKKRRRLLRTIEKGFSDKEKEKEKPSYVAGWF